MSSFRRNGKLEYQRAREQAEWDQWRFAHLELIRQAGVDWFTLRSRDSFYGAMASAYRNLWRTHAQHAALTALLETLEEEPERIWPNFFRPERPSHTKTSEDQWLGSTERELCREGFRRATPRQLRLFAAACCRRLPDIEDLGCDEALDIIERHADDRATATDLGWARETAEAALAWARRQRNLPGAQAAALLKIAAQVHLRPHFKPFLELPDAQRASWRELLGNPFQRQRLAERRPALSADIARLAAAIYEERAFDGLPALGDALEETGCLDADVLRHCRDASISHTRGCWALDWVRGIA